MTQIKTDYISKVMNAQQYFIKESVLSSNFFQKNPEIKYQNQIFPGLKIFEHTKLCFVFFQKITFSFECSANLNGAPLTRYPGLQPCISYLK